MVNKCDTCGNFCSKGEKYCCEKCSNGLTPKQYKKECKGCSDTIVTTPSEDKKYCSKECESQSSILEKECPQCGKNFTTPQSVDSKYCGQDCMAKSYADGRLKGSNHPRWKPKVVKICVICEERFKVFPKDEELKYCSIDCMSEDYKGKFVGKDSPNYDRVKVECGNCKKELERTPFRNKKYERAFCCMDCEKEWISENLSGENHPNWKGGHEDYYGENWRSIRRKVLERDDYSCKICGKSKKELGRHPSVHHIKPLREFDNAEDANTLDNLICLCESHHSVIEGWNLVPSNISL